MARLNWRGDDVVKRTMAAARRAVDQTTADAVVDAKTSHPWRNRTGTLEGSIQLRPARAVGSTVTGLWGSFDVNYAKFLEADPDWEFLQPAANRQYPKLAGRIRQALK